MDAGEGHGLLLEAIVFLGAAIIVVPVFRRFGLGSILGYLIAGAIIGPYGFRFFFDAEAVMHTAEFGVVLLLFVIGLELKPPRLWNMRRDIFGLGAAQVILTGAALTALAVAAGYSTEIALVAGFGLALSSTAFVLQLLKERGRLNTTYGQRAFAILMFQDISIVPLLAMVPILGLRAGLENAIDGPAIALAVAALAAIVVIGRYALDPLFRLLAKSGAQEMMTAAALLTVIGAAAAMAAVGLSMALGAFLAGVMLADSSYRHQLEGDIEPFRGLLLGLFFIAVGMSVNRPLVIEHWREIALLVAAFMGVKALGLYGLSLAFGASRADAGRIAVALPQGGEFAFVIFAAAVANGVMDRETSNLLIAAVALSMALTPVLVAAHERLARRHAAHGDTISEDIFDGNDRRVILIGFGRFGQIVAGVLHSWGCGLTAIDNAPDRIEAARTFGYKVYFGDATRVSVLRAAGADETRLIVLCINNREAINKAIEQIRQQFPQAAIFCRANDRTHAIELMDRDVDFQVRETLESAIALGREALRLLGASSDEADQAEDSFRSFDRERLILQRAQGLHAAIEHLPHRHLSGAAAKKKAD